MSGSGRRNGSFKEKIITVQLLDKTTLNVPIQHKTRYGDILIKIRKHLSLSSSNVFGLAYKTEYGDFSFVDPLGKVWKRERSVSQNTESNERANIIYLRVQYYVNASHQFRSDADKKHYYLQLKENFLRYGFNYPDDRCFLLASYAIYSDEINWREFDPREYFPAWVLKNYGTQFVRKHMPTIIPERMSPCQAMSTYISELSQPSPYIYNMRLYRLQCSKSEASSTVRIGLCPEGLEIYEVDERGYFNFLNGCSWKQMSSIQAVRKKLLIGVHGRCLEFYTHSEEWCRQLSRMIKNCQELYTGVENGTHTLQYDEPTSPSCPAFREAYIYSDEHDLELEYEQSLMGTLRSTSTMKCDSDYISTDDISLSDIYTPSSANSNMAARFSIISTTSSTTTSGIVSDRTCLSTEVSQEDFISNGTRPSSCDSLLEGEYDTCTQTTRPVTVQRAISEPSKNFEHLRFRARRSPKSLPRRALSDETIDEHDYENIAIVRKVLEMKQNASKNRNQSASKSVDQILPQRSKSQSSNKASYNCYVQPSIASPVSHHTSSVSSPLPFHNRYSLISNSPSMEQLLMDYTPPPSYNEAHARQGERLLAASRQVSEDSTNSASSGFFLQSSPLRTSSPAVSKTIAPRPHLFKQRSESQKSPSTTKSLADFDSSGTSLSSCTCLHLSHPEIDKLRMDVSKELISLPMISALCNDKELLQTAKTCTCNQKPISPRPTSWHCDSNPVFSFPPTSVNEHVSVAEVCR